MQPGSGAVVLQNSAAMPEFVLHQLWVVLWVTPVRRRPYDGHRVGESGGGGGDDPSYSLSSVKPWKGGSESCVYTDH